MMKAINRRPVTVTWLTAGYCTHPEWVTIRGGSRRNVRFPAGFAVIEHPERGILLFDTGYASRFFDAAAGWPYWIYREMTPVFFEERQSAASQLLDKFGKRAEEIRTVIVSHFHADHIAGLRDFPEAAFYCFRSAYEAIRGKRGWSALRAGFLPDLMPSDFAERAVLLEGSGDSWQPLPDDLPFSTGCDLFGDGSVVAVDVSGHAAGQMGVFMTTEEGELFLCADAVWSSRAYRERRPPHPAASIIMSSRSDYRTSFEKLCQLHEDRPNLRIMPSHCREYGVPAGKEENG
ncbi:MBL fold metallo-hydrolase [Paenibacillus oceani]|nr:MBL fold metallo-hydrolase [Paenibacillus oceani]